MTLYHLPLGSNQISSQLHNFVAIGWIPLKSEGMIVFQEMLIVFIIIMWVLKFFVYFVGFFVFWNACEHHNSIYLFFVICSWYHYKCNAYCVTQTRWRWDHFAFLSCGLNPKKVSYLYSFLVSVPLLLTILYLHNERLWGHTVERIWFEFHYQCFVYLCHG